MRIYQDFEADLLANFQRKMGKELHRGLPKEMKKKKSCRKNFRFFYGKLEVLSID